jgi:hypothetical protein
MRGGEENRPGSRAGPEGLQNLTFSQVECEVAEDQIGTGAFDGAQAFQYDFLFVNGSACAANLIIAYSPLT